MTGNKSSIKTIGRVLIAIALAFSPKATSETLALVERLPVVSPELVDTVISGDAHAAAEALLEITYDELHALASVYQLLPRLEQCGGKMDDDILVREDGQPLWMRLYDRRGAGPRNMRDRQHQILTRLADCIREATPSVEKARTRALLFKTLEPSLSPGGYGFEVALRAVVFTHPFTGGVRSETGWDELFALFDRVIFSGEPNVGQIDGVRGPYLAYCRQYPDRAGEVVDKVTPVLGSGFGEFLEASKQASFVQTYCSEQYYRDLLSKSMEEWIAIYANRDDDSAASIIEGLLAGTRQARLESFELVKPYFETFTKDRSSYYNWIGLFKRYCAPVPGDAEADEISRQQWLFNVLEGQLQQGNRGDPKLGADPVRLLGQMIQPAQLGDREKPGYKEPFGKQEVLDLLLEQVGLANFSAAESALRALDQVIMRGGDTSGYIGDALNARKQTIRTNEYHEDSAREKLLNTTDRVIRRARSSARKAAAE